MPALKNTVNLYVDDLRPCPEGFMAARSYTEAVSMLSRYRIGILSLDHDLGCDRNGLLLPTGYDIVRYFCANGLYADRIYLHTGNPVGKHNMYETLLAAQKQGQIDRNIRIYSWPCCSLY